MSHVTRAPRRAAALPSSSWRRARDSRGYRVDIERVTEGVIVAPRPLHPALGHLGSDMVNEDCAGVTREGEVR